MRRLQGLILAAGRGSRLGPLTEAQPKALVPLCGKPLIEWQLLALRSGGVADVRAVGGYRATLIRDYVEVIPNLRWGTTNMVYSLLQFANGEEADVFVSYSDIVYSAAAVASLVEASGDIAITYAATWEPMWAARFADPLEDAESFAQAGGLVVDIGRRRPSRTEINGQFMGLVKLTANGWRDCVHFASNLPPGLLDELDMTGLLSRMITAGHKVQAVRYDGPWAEVDSQEDLNLYSADPHFAPLRDMLEKLGR